MAFHITRPKIARDNCSSRHSKWTFSTSTNLPQYWKFQWNCPLAKVLGSALGLLCYKTIANCFLIRKLSAHVPKLTHCPFCLAEAKTWHSWHSLSIAVTPRCNFFGQIWVMLSHSRVRTATVVQCTNLSNRWRGNIIVVQWKLEQKGHFNKASWRAQAKDGSAFPATIIYTKLRATKHVQSMASSIKASIAMPFTMQLAQQNHCTLCAKNAASLMSHWWACRLSFCLF